MLYNQPHRLLSPVSIVILVLLLCLLADTDLKGSSKKEEEDSGISKVDALRRALEFTGMRTEASSVAMDSEVTIPLIAFVDPLSPFTGGQVRPTHAWEIQLTEVTLQRESAPKDSGQPILRDFVVYIDQATGCLLRACSPYEGDLRQPGPWDEMERAGIYPGTSKRGFPSDPPDITLRQALQHKRIKQLHDAKEIVAYCVRFTWVGHHSLPFTTDEPRLVWCIFLKDLDLAPEDHPNQENTTIGKRYLYFHMIDAMSGEYLHDLTGITGGGKGSIGTNPPIHD